MSVAESLVQDLEAEAVKTRQMLEIAPADQFDWRPHEKSWKLAELVSHLAEAPSWIPSMQADEMDFAAMEDYRPFLAGSPDEAVRAFDRNLTEALSFIRDKDDDFLSRLWTMRKGDQILMQEPRHDVMRMIAIHHMIHHRGQLSVYLRLLDVPLPPVFGPTADHPDM